MPNKIKKQGLLQVKRRHLVSFGNLVKVPAHRYTILQAYLLLFTRCLCIINHQPKVSFPTSFLSSNTAMDPLVLTIPPFTGRETEAGTWQSWRQQMLWAWMFQRQVKRRALRTGSGMLLALGQREGHGHLLMSFPVLLSVV